MFCLLTVVAPYGDSFVNLKERQTALRMGRFVRHLAYSNGLPANKLDKEDDKEEIS
jgi:hypothetical protein